MHHNRIGNQEEHATRALHESRLWHKLHNPAAALNILVMISESAFRMPPGPRGPINAIFPHLAGTTKHRKKHNGQKKVEPADLFRCYLHSARDAGYLHATFCGKRSRFVSLGLGMCSCSCPYPYPCLYALS